MQPTQPQLGLALPFGIDHAATVPLVDQVASGLQGAIQSGCYAPGDRLPRVRDLARELGVSVVVANQAVSRLAESGHLVARRKSGIRVTARHEKIWRAHVLWLTDNTQSFFFTARQEALLRGLEAANIRTTSLPVPVPADEGALVQVRAALQTMNITLVACGTASPALAAECARHGIPLVACEGEPVAASGGRVTVREQGALEAMAAHCAGLGLQRIAVLSPINKKLESLREAFAAQGLAINALTPAGPWEGEGPTERLERVGYMSAQAMLNFGELPDVLYVTDDYAARGCLTALLAAGMRIPDDLQLIIHVNRRHLPIFSRPFTRIEVDPEAHGALLATTILAVLDNEPGAPPVVNISTSRFIVGETTGPRRPAGSPSA